MKKLFLTILFTLVLSGNVYAKIFVLNKCWDSIEKNVYGDKVRNFKEFKKIKEIKDHIIKIDSEKKTIVKIYVLDDEQNINPFDHDIFIEFEIYNFKNNIIKGKVRDKWTLEEIINSQKKKDKYQTAIEHRGKLIAVDLNKRKAAIWKPTQNKDTIKFNISCKLYKGSDDSILRSILKMINN